MMKQKNPEYNNLYTGSEFIKLTKYDPSTIVLNCLNIYNDVYNLNMTQSEMNDIKTDFLNFMKQIKNEVITK